MSEILQLAKTFEENLNEQARSTRLIVSAELSQHERSLREALKSSETILIRDIQDSQQRLRNTALNSWKWMLITLVLIGLSVAAALGVTSWMISNNIMQISEQKKTLAQLETHGVRLLEQTKDGEKVVYLMLPKGRKMGEPFMFEKQPTVQIMGN